MIGRGAVGAPWIFHQLRTGAIDIENLLKHEIIMEHFDKMIEFYGDHGVAMFRKHTHTYSKGYRGASMLRNDVNRIDNIADYRDVIDEFFKNSEIIT
jgi:tRNA-dihydrouridine synthase B